MEKKKSNPILRLFCCHFWETEGFLNFQAEKAMIVFKKCARCGKKKVKRLR